MAQIVRFPDERTVSQKRKRNDDCERNKIGQQNASAEKYIFDTDVDDRKGKEEIANNPAILKKDEFGMGTARHILVAYKQ
jgi:hypothetical protein